MMLVYKYRKYGSQVDRDRVDDTIRRGYVWAPTRSKLYDLDRNDMRHGYEKDYISPHIEREYVKHYKVKTDIYDHIVKHMRSADERLFGGYAVASLCRVKDSQYMWGKYAGGASGLCLEYDITNEEGVRNVSYTGMYNIRASMYAKARLPTKWSYLEVVREILEGVVYSKGEEFSKECEIRCLYHELTPEERANGGKMIGSSNGPIKMTKVILGNDINGEHAAHIYDLCDSVGIPYEWRQ